MPRIPLTIGLLSTLLAAAGCTMLGQQPAPVAAAAPVVMPVSSARHGAGHGEANYALGRYYQGQRRYDDAIRAYREVLEAEPDHADAHNALGVIYANQRRYELAEWEIRTALRLRPDAAYVHNNLGYALLLQGRFAEAVSAFGKALFLEPGQPRAADNLKAAQARLAERTAGAEPGLNLRFSEMLAAVIGGGDGAPPPSAVRLEIANGNGVTGLARQISAQLREAGYGAVRFTNQKPFDQERTEIQFRPGFQRQAQGLQAALAGRGVLARSDSLAQDIHLRVVLGRDLTAAPATEARGGEPLRLATRME